MRESGELSLQLTDEAATRAAGAALARVLIERATDGILVTLSGELGAGKTTWVRGFLQALGADGPVRSPTYTLIESYALGSRTVHHLDWYRLADAADLEGLGFRDLAGPGQWVLIEWPERAPAVAAAADLRLELMYQARGRGLRLVAGSATGAAVLAALKAANALG